MALSRKWEGQPSQNHRIFRAASVNPVIREGESGSKFSDVALAVHARSHTGNIPKLIGEGALIAETEYHGDLGDRASGVGEFVSGSVNSGLNNELLDGHAEGAAE